MHLYARYYFLSVLLALLPGCGINYSKMSREEFPQGDELPLEPEVSYHNVRSARVYDEFMTLAVFDALYLSERTRAEFARLYTRKRGQSEEQYERLLNRELQQNEQYISFFVLADVRGDEHTSLTDRDAIWTMYLEMPNGRKVTPYRVQEVELSPEMQSFFAYRFSRYKQPYEVKFLRVNGLDMPLKLVFSSVDRRIEMLWGGEVMVPGRKKKYVRVLKQKQQPAEVAKRKDEDFYWL